ncbi:MAG: hypothetical protein KKB51_10255 [Candidatus Riflebacteria bacterium]|nr:hypothetical protein [Candidatus Riflebacteria bacterium]
MQLAAQVSSTRLFQDLLELSKNAQKVTVVGPSTTLAPLLFDYGVRDLSGFVVKNFEKATRMIKGA